MNWDWQSFAVGVAVGGALAAGALLWVLWPHLMRSLMGFGVEKLIEEVKK